MVVLVALLAGCASSAPPHGGKDLVGLEGAWARLNAVRKALNVHSRAILLLFNEMEHPYGPKGRAAMRRATLALHLADKRLAAADLPDSLESGERRMRQSMRALLAAWRRHAPRLRSTLARHEKLSWHDGMIFVEHVQNDLEHGVDAALYAVSVLSCEASDRDWNPDDGYCVG